MNEQYQCKNCSYFFGKEGIHCAIYPYGKESEYCGDWQLKTLTWQQEKLMKSLNTDMETKSFSYSKLCKYILLAGVTLLFGYQLYQNIPPAIRAEKDYDNYKTECEIFLNRASKAGTTGVASAELARGVDWLNSHYSNQSFEYRDLKANLDYLQKQPGNLVMPVTITDSISSNLENIKEKQLKLLDNGRPGMGGLADLVIFSFVLILICLLILVLAVMVMELVGA